MTATAPPSSWATDNPQKDHLGVAERISGESETAITEFESAFRSDLALTADLRMVANSAAFGFRAMVDTIRHALTLLERVRSLGFTIAMSFYTRNVPGKDDVRTVWRIAPATAVIADLLGRAYNSTGI